jgi:hypothetical protein
VVAIKEVMYGTKTSNHLKFEGYSSEKDTSDILGTGQSIGLYR